MYLQGLIFNLLCSPASPQQPTGDIRQSNPEPLQCFPVDLFDPQTVKIEY